MASNDAACSEGEEHTHSSFDCFPSQRRRRRRQRLIPALPGAVNFPLFALFAAAAAAAASEAEVKSILVNLLVTLALVWFAAARSPPRFLLSFFSHTEFLPFPPDRERHSNLALPAAAAAAAAADGTSCNDPLTPTVSARLTKTRRHY